MSIFEQTGGTFSNINGYLIPDLMTADSTPIGKWGRMRKRYLKEQHPILYTDLLISEKLYPHCAEIDRTCEDRLGIIIRQMAEQEDVTEGLKAANQIEWVARMNSIHSRAEEIVLHELIYTEEAEDADT